MSYTPRSRPLPALGLAALGLVLPACSLFGPPTSVSIRLESGKDLNQNRSGVSSPVNIRIYQLSDDAKFQDADFAKIWDDDESSLEGSLVRKRELDLAAESNSEFELQVQKGTRFIGVMGLFDKEEDKEWRVVVPIEDVSDLTFFFEGYTITKRDR